MLFCILLLFSAEFLSNMENTVQLHLVVSVALGANSIIYHLAKHLKSGANGWLLFLEETQDDDILMKRPS